jgi:predicted P-loop ATPase
MTTTPEHPDDPFADYVDVSPRRGRKPRETAEPPAATRAAPEFEFGAAWKQFALKAKNGELLGNVSNCLLALRSDPKIKDAIAFDEFRQRTIARKDLPWCKLLPGVAIDWTASHDVNFAAWVQAQGVNASIEVAAQAVDTVARERLIHPVREYLAGLAWDGETRLEAVPAKYFGAEVEGEDNEQDEKSAAHAFIGAAFAKFAISAVARIMQPGSKVDSCLVLEGRQGLLKSTALRALFWPWFTDDVAELGTKDSAMQLAGAWCIEVPEFASGRRADKERLKAFVSRAVDRFRPPYGRRVIEVPRQCVFASTVNDSDYLRDETGNRRFWPIACKKIEIDGLAGVRDQLWAEALSRFHADEPWWIDDTKLEKTATREQEARYSSDVWREKIIDYLVGKNEVSIAQVLKEAVEIPVKEFTRADQTRIGSELTALGWQRLSRRRDGKPVRYYARPREELLQPGPPSQPPKGEVAT